MRYFLISMFFFSSFSNFAQVAIDTLDTEHGVMIIYSDRTWEYIQDVGFDGVLNSTLAHRIKSDTSLNYKQTWDHDVCYTSGLSNDLNRLKDTIWLCLQDSISEGFVMPFDGLVTSHYGWRRGRNHNGTDIDLETGDTVRAAWSGKIRYAKYNDSGFGNLVIIRHYNGLETFYAHLSKHLVVPNDVVIAGQPIGLGGNTGHSYGSHLHFEVRFYDAAIDPEKLLDFEKGEVRDENLLVHRGLFKGTVTQSTALNNMTVTNPTPVTARYYRVKSGDTLSGIAAKNRTTVSKICQLNGIRPTTVIQIGKNLRIQ